MAISIRERLTHIGVDRGANVAVRGSFGRRTPRRLRAAVDGMVDIRVDGWVRRGTALSEENTAFSVENQGATSDGVSWFACSNGTKTVIRFDDRGNRVRTYVPPPPQGGGGWGSTHFGAPAVRDGWVYVPLQGPHAVWRVRVDGSDGRVDRVTDRPDGNMLPWVDVHPVTGVLYTSSFDEPRFVRAYDRASLDRRPQDDIRLGRAPEHVDRIQGAVFTDRGRLLMVRSHPNAVFAFSSLNGHCHGARKLGDFGSIGSEVEQIAIRPWRIGGRSTPVHISELDNDELNEDDLYVHSFEIPAPRLL